MISASRSTRGPFTLNVEGVKFTDNSLENGDKVLKDHLSLFCIWVSLENVHECYGRISVEVATHDT